MLLSYMSSAVLSPFHSQVLFLGRSTYSSNIVRSTLQTAQSLNEMLSSSQNFN